MTRTLASLAAVGLVLMAIGAVQAAGKYARWAGGDVQIRGYDTTAYFKAGKPAIGDAGNAVNWDSGTWHFKTQQDAAAFRSNPSAFAPQFGAYCTGGLSQRHVVNGNPTIWRMHKGKLYMFYAHAGAKRFDKDPAGVIAAARAYAKIVGIREN